MFPFRTSRGATFRCDADFSASVAVNINFFDAARDRIPFHVSLRRDEQLIVVNRRHDAGWSREIKFPKLFKREPVPVEVQISRNHADLWVDGVKIGRFDVLPRLDRSGRFNLRRGFSKLSEISFVDIEGPYAGDSLVIECPAIVTARPDYPVLNDSIEVVLSGLTPDFGESGQQAVLSVEGFDEEIPAVLRILPYLLPRDRQRRRAHELAAILPGRVWDSGVDPLVTTLFDGAGKPLGDVRVSRKELVERIGQLAESGNLATDDRAALQAIEHTRHAKIFTRLSPTQRQALLAAAERFRLGRYLLENVEPTGGAAANVPALPEDGVWQHLEALRNQFSQQMRDEPDTAPLPLLRSLIDAADLPTPVLELLLIALTEWFCLNDSMRDLAQLWHDLGLRKLSPVVPEGDNWKTSALLPLYYLHGEFEAVAIAIKALAVLEKGWTLTPNIGWILRKTAIREGSLKGRLPSSEQRDAILDSAKVWLTMRQLDYWDRTPCIAIITGMVAVLERSETLARQRKDDFSWAVLQAYGLMPSFWSAVEKSLAATGWELTPRMKRAQMGFAELQACLDHEGADTRETHARIAAVLQRFQSWDVNGVLQYRRELLGHAGLALDTSGLPDLWASRLAGMDPDEAALRYLAHPSVENRGAALPKDMAQAVVEGLKLAHHVVPESQFHDDQVALLQGATALAAAPDAVMLTRFLSMMDATSSSESRYLGLGVGLSLASMLLSQSRTEDAETLVRRIVALIESLPDDWMHAELVWAPAPSLAMAAFARAHPDQPLMRVAQKALGLAAQSLVMGDDLPLSETQANPLLNTVVCLYTCRANLDTRVAVIRKGWMRLLADMGVACLVFVGGGDGTREDDVVHLDAPDDYEGLPQKTLAMVRWVMENTSFAYMIKVDDDCFLDPQAYFQDLTYQKFDYYGRPLTRTRGQMDRTWHMAKSTHARGQLELDKSPEPSTYADGGSGYSLSRQAMVALCEATETPAGQEIIHLSFMEDKLVGDLLTLDGIKVSGEDYRMSVLRRTKPGGPLVPAWQNGFLPFKGSGIKIAHLDGHEKQDEVLAGRFDAWPHTLKVWPSYQPVKLGWNTNTLDLISTPEKLAQVNEAEVAVVVCLRNEMFMLPRFLEHYRALGVKGFLIADNGSDDGSFEYLDAQPDVALFAVDTEYRVSHYGVAWQQALISNFRVGRWSLAADADELVFWNADRTGSLRDLTKTLDAEGADTARIFMLDMYPQDTLSGADFKSSGPFEQAAYVDRAPFLAVSGARGPYSNSSIWTSALRHRLIPGSRSELFVAQKYALLKYRPWMRLSAGLHFVADCVPSRQELFFAHFKYNAAFRAKAETEVARQQHFNDAEEYRKYLALVSEGRDVVFDPEVSVRWDECAFVRDRLVR